MTDLKEKMSLDKMTAAKKINNFSRVSLLKWGYKNQPKKMLKWGNNNKLDTKVQR